VTDSRVAPYRSPLDLPNEWAAHPGLFTGISAGIAATMGEKRGFLTEGERGLLIYTVHDGAPHPGIPSVMDVQAGQVSLLGLGTPEAVARLVNRLVREGHLEDDAISAVVQYALAKVNTLVADISPRPGDNTPDLLLLLAAERTSEYSVIKRFRHNSFLSY
jgi:hypothetical protein